MKETLVSRRGHLRHNTKSGTSSYVRGSTYIRTTPSWRPKKF